MTPPHLLYDELPQVDQEAARHIGGQLYNLSRFVDRFNASLALKEHSEKERQSAHDRRTASKNSIRGAPDYAPRFDAIQSEFQSAHNLFLTWRSIAERDAVMTIWDLCKTVYEIRNGLDRCKSLNDLVSRSKLEKAILQTSEAFPDRKDARDVAAHPSDLTTMTPARIARHSYDGPLEEFGLTARDGVTGTFMYHVSLGDGSIISSFEGRVIRAKINAETLSTLDRIRNQVYAAFAPAEIEMKRIMLKRLGLPPEKFFHDDL